MHACQQPYPYRVQQLELSSGRMLQATEKTRSGGPGRLAALRTDNRAALAVCEA